MEYTHVPCVPVGVRMPLGNLKSCVWGAFKLGENRSSVAVDECLELKPSDKVIVGPVNSF